MIVPGCLARVVFFYRERTMSSGFSETIEEVLSADQEAVISVPSNGTEAKRTIVTGWWRMRDNTPVQVFRRDVSEEKNTPFVWCGMSRCGSILMWTETGSAVHTAVSTTAQHSDDLVEYMGPPDSMIIERLTKERDEILRQRDEAQLAHLTALGSMGKNSQTHYPAWVHPNLQLILQKTEKCDNQNQQGILRHGLAVVSQLVRKNMDYQGSAFQNPVLMPKVSPLVAMSCRASDKIARLSNLMSGAKAHVTTESIRDTVGDLAGYCILMLSYMETLQGEVDLQDMVGEDRENGED